MSISTIGCRCIQWGRSPRSAKNNWDFWTSLPEALHQITIVMSDRGIPATYRHMHGFGSHTFSVINAKNERHWVKFHFKSQQGIKNLTDRDPPYSNQGEVFQANYDPRFTDPTGRTYYLRASYQF